MADYRDWCGSCGAEINFGGHNKGCAYMAKERAAKQELLNFEKELYETYRNKTEDEILDEAAEVYEDVRIFAQVLAAHERKWKFLRQYMWMERDLLDKFKEKTGTRYV